MHTNGGNDQIAFVSAPGKPLYKPSQPQSRNVARGKSLAGACLSRELETR
jgi:hypothetical protein